MQLVMPVKYKGILEIIFGKKRIKRKKQIKKKSCMGDTDTWMGLCGKDEWMNIV